MIEFDKIPFQFISHTLTGFQKKSIEIKYEIISRISTAKIRGDKEIIFYEIASDLKIEYSSVRNIYYTLIKK